jgi:hypothetical protein
MFMVRIRGRLSRVAVFLLASLAAPGAALASPDTLRMAFADLLEGPVDVVSAPVVAGRTLVHNAGEVGLEPVGPVAYGILGSVGLTALEVGWGVARTLSGAVMLLPGIVLLPFPGVDVPQEADVFSHGDPLFAWKNPLGEAPFWEKVVIPKPVSMDAKLGIEVPYSRYPETEGVGAVYPDEAAE